MFDEDYYMNGIATGVSNYVNYSWIPETTIPMAQVVKKVLGITQGQTFLDFGASRGYLVKALRLLDVHSFGYDLSTWAVSHCDPDVKSFMTNTFPERDFDWVWSKDTFEHIQTEDLLLITHKLFSLAKRGMFVIVPLAESKGGKYLCPNDEQDKTHVQRLTMSGWLTLLQSTAPQNWVISGSYKVPTLKASSELYPLSTAFITCKPL